MFPSFYNSTCTVLLILHAGFRPRRGNTPIEWFICLLTALYPIAEQQCSALNNCKVQEYNLSPRLISPGNHLDPPEHPLSQMVSEIFELKFPFVLR